MIFVSLEGKHSYVASLVSYVVFLYSASLGGSNIIYYKLSFHRDSTAVCLYRSLWLVTCVLYKRHHDLVLNEACTCMPIICSHNENTLEFKLLSSL